MLLAVLRHPLLGRHLFGRFLLRMLFETRTTRKDKHQDTEEGENGFHVDEIAVPPSAMFGDVIQD